jgi:HlyD family secretion protein
VVLVGLGLLGLAGRSQEPDVSVTRATRETVESWVTSNGTVEPIRPYVLRSRLDTFIKHVAVVEGQVVQAGQLLVELDASDTAANLAQARQNLLTAEHELQNAQAGGPPDQVAELASQLTKTRAMRDRLAAEQQTLSQLVADHAATQDELAENKLKLEQAEADLRYLEQKQQTLERQAQFEVGQARLRIDQAKAQIADLSVKLASARLVAPVSGTVYGLRARMGNYVHVGDDLVELANLSQVRVRAYVDEVDLGAIAPNEAVEIQWDAIPGRVWNGRTEVIPKEVEPYRERSVGEVLCSVSNTDQRLLPNTNVDVRIRVAHHTGALVVPRAAVQGGGSSCYVYLVEGDRLHKRSVRTGAASTSQFEVLEGLNQGDLVAIPGAVNLYDGLQIHPVEEVP